MNGLVVEPEHRGYGASQPTGSFDTRNLGLLTPQQALADAAALVLSIQQQRGCTGRTPGETRCPVIAIGGSYPGWLAAMMRMRYPAVVDIAYSGSSPMKFYAQAVDQYAYYAVITESARRASPQCPDAVRRMLAATLASAASKDTIIAKLNLCTPLPPYIEAGDMALLVDELSMVVRVYACVITSK